MSGRGDDRYRQRDSHRDRSRSRERAYDGERATHRDRERDRSPDRYKGKERARDRDVAPTADAPRRRYSRSPPPTTSHYSRDQRDRRRARSRSDSRSRSPRRRRSRSPRKDDSGDAKDKGDRTRRRSRSRSLSPDRSREKRRRSRSRSRSRSVSSASSDSSERRRHRRKKDKKEKKKDKKDKKKKKSSAALSHQWGKYGIINETDIYNKEQEFRAWLVEERKINPETISKDQNKKEFAKFVEDYNTATLPHEKFYHMEQYERRMSALRAGEYVPPPNDSYDPTADLRAHESTHRRKAVEQDTYMSKEQLQELRRVQNERIEAGRMKLLGMDIKQTMGVRMDGTMFDG